MNKKDLVGDLFNQLRLRRQRMAAAGQPSGESAELEETLGQMLMVSDHLDSLIGRSQPSKLQLATCANGMTAAAPFLYSYFLKAVVPYH